jgi:hypothetical protein
MLYGNTVMLSQDVWRRHGNAVVPCLDVLMYSNAVYGVGIVRYGVAWQCCDIVSECLDAA